ncbi:MAG: protein-export chaperone SecB [Gammaproteobacteria bacterium]|nr:protein-export chaperone SecB [Gammaproteobacteria bacterium]
MAEQTNGGQKPFSGRRFAARSIYLKDASFESPSTPAIFSANENPRVSVNLRTDEQNIDEASFESVLIATVEAKVGEETAFLVEVQQAGIFEAEGYSEEEMHELQGSYCPSLLFPFAREAVCNLVVKGGFPQLQLQPVNFTELYQKRKAAAAQANEA